MGVEVFGGEYLSASGANLAVQIHRGVSRRRGRLPGIVPVPVFPPPARLPLHSPAVCVGRQQLLLLGGVRQQHQQLVEDAVEVVSEQVLTAAVVLRRRDHALDAEQTQSLRERSKCAQRP